MLILFTVTEYVASIVLFCVYIWLLSCYFSRSSFPTILFFVFGSLYVLITSFPLGNLIETQSPFIGMMIQLVTVVILFSGKPTKKIVVWLFFNVIDYAISIICLTGFQVFPWTNHITVFTSHSLENFLFLMVSLSLEIFVISLLAQMKNRSSISIPKNQIIVILLLFINNFFAVILVDRILFSVKDGEIKDFCLIILLVFVVASVCILYLMQHLQTQAEATIQNKLLNIQISEQKKQLLSYQENEERIRIIRHDFKHYLLQYVELLKNGETERVLEDMTFTLDKKLYFDQITYTDNSLFNALVCYSANCCKEKDILFSVSINLSSNYYDSEIAVMVLNILDNAIEAEMQLPEPLRRIYLEITTLNQDLSVLIQNRIEHSVLDINPKLVSTKKEHEFHGFGIKSVQNIIKKRNGLLDIYEESGMFCVHFIIGFHS